LDYEENQDILMSLLDNQDFIKKEKGLIRKISMRANKILKERRTLSLLPRDKLEKKKKR
jgi:hypothetical protein